MILAISPRLSGLRSWIADCVVGTAGWQHYQNLRVIIRGLLSLSRRTRARIGQARLPARHPLSLSTGHVLFHGLGSLALCDPDVSIMTPFPTSLTLFLNLQDMHLFKMVTASQLRTHSSLSPLLRGLRSTPMSPQPAHPPGHAPSNGPTTGSASLGPA